MDDLIKALQIFAQYSNYKNSERPTICEHDELIVLVDPTIVSKEDIGRLSKLGFFADEEFGTFKSFRFGSA